MKHKIIIGFLAIFVLINITSFSWTYPYDMIDNSSGMQIAEIILNNHFGKDFVNRQKPFKTTFDSKTIRIRGKSVFNTKRIDITINKVNCCITNIYPKVKKANLIESEEIAVQIAEVVLFRNYGEQKIKGEKPYNIRSVEDLWCIYGSLKKGYIGGVFEIKIQKKDGRVILMTHGK
jgi:hypothetical protein